MDTQNIVTLIQALSPTEKQYFKKLYNTDSDFVHLFNYVNKYKDYHSEKFKTYLNKKRKTNKDYSSGHLFVVKNYLHEKILESLRARYIPRRTSYEMLTRSINADILLEKGLYQLAKKEINTVKKKTNNANFPIENLLIYRRESIIQFYEDYKNSTLHDILDLYEKRIDAGEQLLLEIKYAQVLSILSFQYFKGEKDQELLQNLMKEDYIKDSSLATVFGTQYLFYWVNAQIAEFQNKPEEAIQFFEKAVLKWLEHPDYIQAHPRMYLGTCHTYLKYILKQKKSIQLVLDIPDLKLLLNKISMVQLQQDVAQKWEQLFQLGQLLIFRREQDYDSIIKYAPSLLRSLEELKFTTDFNKILAYYFVALANFQKQKYKKTDQLLRLIIQNESVNLKANPEYFNHVLILNLLNEYELKNLKFLKFELSRTKQELINHQKLGAFEQQVLSMFSQLISKRYIDQYEKVFIRFRKRLKAVMEEEHLEDLMEYQFVLGWIQYKIEEIHTF